MFKRVAMAMDGDGGDAAGQRSGLCPNQRVCAKPDIIGSANHPAGHNRS
jgi:hypothetical protein